MKGGEPSGKDPGHAAGRDEAYPRGIVRDLDRDIHRVDLVGAIGLTKRIRYGPDGGNEYFASEWLAPWKYPLVNAAGNGVAQELPFTHVGPYLAGEESTVLLSGKKGDKEARRRLEEADTPARTAAELAQLLPREQHLGTPVEYSRYLVARMLGDDQSHLTEFSVEDFNLDSDRGYAWHCWDWVRGSEPCVAKGAQVPTPGVHFQYSQPVTSPQLFAAEDDGTLEPPRWHDPRSDLEARYLDEEH
jgi:hypothetical protein